MTYPSFESADLAREEAKRLSRETGDVHCVMQWHGEWIVYALGYGPIANEEDD